MRTIVVAVGCLAALGGLWAATAMAETVQYQVAASVDDAATTSSGCNYATANIYFPYSYGSRPGFFRWAIDIPAGATVTSAYLKVNAHETGSAAATARLQLVDSDNCPALNSPNPYYYATTAGYVDWTFSEGWTAGEWYTSPDIAAIVQEFIDRPAYTSGNYLGLKQDKASGGTRQVRQWDYGDHSYGAILEVNYTTAAQEKVVTLSIRNSQDDVKCFESYVQHTGTSIYFPYSDATRKAAWRFKSYIPPNATITDARMRLKMSYVTAQASTGRLQLFDTDNCPVFSIADNPWTWDLMDPTSLYADWVFPSTLAVDDWVESPDLSAMLQAFVDRQADPLDPESTGYVFGNHFGLMGTPVSGAVKTVYDSYVDETTIDPDRAAQIDVTFTGGDAILEFRMADPHVRIGQPIYVWVFNANPNDTLRITLTDPQSNDTVLFQQAGGLDLEDEIVFDADWSGLTSGQYTLTAEVIAPNSTVRGSESYTWTRLHNGVPKVGIDLYNNICIRDASGDPQPFIPVTSWMLGVNHYPTHPVSPCINTLLMTGYYPSKNVASWLDYLDFGVTQGLYGAGPGAWDTKADHHTWYETDPNDLISYINGSKGHNGLLAWFWMDEPDLYQAAGSYIEPITTREWTTLCHQYDTDHPVWVNLEGYTYSPNAAYHRQFRSVDWLFETNEHVFGQKTLLTDIIGIDYYPYEYTTKFEYSTLADFVLTLDRVRWDNRDLAPTVIFIETQDVRDPNAEGHSQPYGYWSAGGEYAWTPDPEPRMLKNEFWLALIHGAKAISYFHYFCPIPTNLQDTMLDFLDDVTDLTPVICSQENAGPEVSVVATNATGNPNDPDYLTSPRIDLTTRVQGDPGEEVIYIFAADLRDLLGATKDDRVVGDGYDRIFNYSPDVVSARFTVDGLLSGTTIQVYGESRSITSGSGYFDDTFDPYGVHIYMIGAESGETQKSYQVAASGDDTYWFNTYPDNQPAHWSTSPDATCPYTSSVRGGGYRWQLDIPAGATITSAVIKLKATGANGTSGTSSVTFEVLDYDSCPSFAGGTAPQVDTVMSGIGATWSIPVGDWTANEWYTSCDVKDLVQAFVGRQNYASGSYLGIRATSGTGTYHKTFQYDSGAANGAVLEVTYTTP